MGLAVQTSRDSSIDAVRVVLLWGPANIYSACVSGLFQAGGEASRYAVSLGFDDATSLQSCHGIYAAGPRTWNYCL